MLLGVRSLLDEGKKVWLLDQYGVLHDGANAYPAAIEATRELHASGAKLFIISNSSRRSGKTLQKLEPMGYDPEWFSGVITSGEITHRKLSVVGTDENAVARLPRDATANERLDATFAALGDRCVHFTWSTRGSIPPTASTFAPSSTSTRRTSCSRTAPRPSTAREHPTPNAPRVPRTFPSNACERFSSARRRADSLSSSPTPTSSPSAARAASFPCPGRRRVVREHARSRRHPPHG